LINQYEILEELGRGEHGKVKLGRHVTTRQKVAIKIVQRYSKRRRLGKLGQERSRHSEESSAPECCQPAGSYRRPEPPEGIYSLRVR
jgi:serine/threonine protein kinase